MSEPRLPGNLVLQTKFGEDEASDMQLLRAQQQFQQILSPYIPEAFMTRLYFCLRTLGLHGI